MLVASAQVKKSGIYESEMGESMNRGWKNVLVSLAMIAMLAPACRAQITPTAGADANSPGGPGSACRYKV